MTTYALFLNTGAIVSVEAETIRAARSKLENAGAGIVLFGRSIGPAA